MSGNLIIHANNVHVGGGRVLLDELLSVSPSGTLAFLDARNTCIGGG